MKCWNCGKFEMFLCPELGSGWYKCSHCGATWVKILKPSAPPMAVKPDVQQGKSGSPRQQRKRKVKSGTTNNANTG